jgi:hypothetical protein
MNKATFSFNKWNTILGCIFSIALLTYTLTVEPTMSFWDCGEYIATAAKLQVGHPPELLSNDWRVLCDVCHRQSTYCSNGKYDFCLFKRIYNLIFILVFIDNFKKISQ